MTINKFGCTSATTTNLQKVIEEETFPKTTHGDYDVENKRLCNISDPVTDQDVVNKKYVDLCLINYKKQKTEMKQHVDQMLTRIKSYTDGFNQQIQLHKKQYNTIHNEIAALEAKVK